MITGLLQKAGETKKANKEAIAKEKIQVEVAGSYGLNGKIDIDNLNTNLEKISGLVFNGDRLSDLNKIKQLPALVTLDGYTFRIKEFGSVDKVIWLDNEDGSYTNTINGKTINVGDRVLYEEKLGTITLTSDSQLIKDLKTYSGNVDESQNTDTTIIQDKTMQWRILDVKDEKIRLVSATSTISKIGLYNYNGYNNAVYLLDKTCDTLYSVNEIGKAQNLKIEDIEEKINITQFDYNQYENSNVNTGKYGGTKEYTSNLKYPNIYKNEVGCKLIDTLNNSGNTLKISEQASLIDGRSTATNILKTTQTYWKKEISKMDFKDFKDSNSKYYTLFINNGSNHSTYWLSSRCVDCGNNSADFNIYNVGGEKVKSSVMVNGGGVSIGSICAFRPVIILEPNVQLTENTIDGWRIQ